MSDPNTLGSLVRKRRLESGYSLGQLASKVGKTAAEVRAWERDSELPEHGIIERLASTLEIDLDEIRKRLEEGRKALEAERKAAAEAAAEAAAAAEMEAEAEAEPEVEEPVARKPAARKPAAKQPAATEPEVEEPAAEEAGVEEPAAQAEDDLPGFAVEDPFTPPPSADNGDTDDESAFDILDAPTEAVPVPVITETATAARAGRASVMLEEPPPPPLPDAGPAPDQDPGLLRYLEPLRMLFDPNSRYLYWIRAGLTIVVLLIFAVILMAQLGNLLDAISELLDTIEPTPGNPDDLNVLGMGRWV